MRYLRLRGRNRRHVIRMTLWKQMVYDPFDRNVHPEAPIRNANRLAALRALSRHVRRTHLEERRQTRLAKGVTARQSDGVGEFPRKPDVNATPQLLVKGRVVVAILGLNRVVESRTQTARRARIRNAHGDVHRLLQEHNRRTQTSDLVRTAAAGCDESTALLYERKSGLDVGRIGQWNAHACAERIVRF